uniref:26S proteasome non-ATPase regulatory subunit 9 n=1 Tax=Cyprinus carpio TaxID=7962 RepID=A0A8C2KE94_CYPCA
MKMTEENNAVKPNVTEDDVRLLIKRKDDIEEQIKAYHDMLQTVSLFHFIVVLKSLESIQKLMMQLEVSVLLCFGSINTHNFRNLRDVASVVQHSEGKSLRVGVIRSGQEVHLNLTPKQWSGRGLLGCNLVPLHR